MIRDGEARATVGPELELTDLVARRGPPGLLQRLAQLRDTCPVAWHEHSRGGFWVVTSHPDVSQVLRETRVFGQCDGHRLDALEQGGANPVSALEAHGHRDGAAPFSLHHQRTRMRFAPDNVEALAPGIRCRIVERLASHAGSGAIDFMTLVSPLPREVRATLAGVPGAHQDRVISWVSTLAQAADAPGDAPPDARRNAATQLAQYGEELLARKLAQPGEDIASDWIEYQSTAGAEFPTGPVTGRQIATLLYALIEVGSATTRNVAGAGQRLLFDNPDVAKRLREDPSRVPGVVEEMLRLAPPLRSVRRTAECDGTLGGQRIAKGDAVTVWLDAAHRDPNTFPAPNCMRTDRASNPHLSCATGGLFSLGATLTRLELRILFEELATRFPELLPAGPCEHAASLIENRILRLPVHLGRAN